MAEISSAQADQESLTLEEQQQVLSMVRHSLQAALAQEPLPQLATPSPALQTHGAAFVSIYRGKELRGCIGTFSRIAPLWEVVQRMALMAATEDPRFSPVRSDEFDELSFEISVLTRPIAIEEPEQIAIGRDGLVISNTRHRGVLLPQVAVKHGWDPIEFLEHTCRKAGLPADFWRKASVLIERFEAIVFGDALVEDK